MFRAIGFEVPDEATYNTLAETADALGDETRIDRRGSTLYGRCWHLGEGIEIWTVLRESVEGLHYVDCRPAFRPRYTHAIGPWELTEYDEDGEAVLEGRVGRAAAAISFELQNLTELRTDTFQRPSLTVALAGLAYDVRVAPANATPGVRASDRVDSAPPPDGNDHVVVGRVEKRLPMVNPYTGVELMWLYMNAGDVRLEILARRDSCGGDVLPGTLLEAEVWMQGYVLNEDAERSRYEGVDPEWNGSDAWNLLRREN